MEKRTKRVKKRKNKKPSNQSIKSNSPSNKKPYQNKYDKIPSHIF